MGVIKGLARYAVMVGGLALAGCGNNPPVISDDYDLNGDGINDRVTTHYDWRRGRYTVSVRLSNPDGSHAQQKRILEINFRPSVTALIDADKDGDTDVVITRGFDRYALLNDGKGNFGTPKRIE